MHGLIFPDVCDRAFMYMTSTYFLSQFADKQHTVETATFKNFLVTDTAPCVVLRCQWLRSYKCESHVTHSSYVTQSCDSSCGYSQCMVKPYLYCKISPYL